MGIFIVEEVKGRSQTNSVETVVMQFLGKPHHKFCLMAFKMKTVLHFGKKFSRVILA